MRWVHPLGQGLRRESRAGPRLTPAARDRRRCAARHEQPFQHDTPSIRTQCQFLPWSWRLRGVDVEATYPVRASRMCGLAWLGRRSRRRHDVRAHLAPIPGPVMATTTRRRYASSSAAASPAPSNRLCDRFRDYAARCYAPAAGGRERVARDGRLRLRWMTALLGRRRFRHGVRDAAFFYFGARRVDWLARHAGSPGCCTASRYARS